MIKNLALACCVPLHQFITMTYKTIVKLSSMLFFLQQKIEITEACHTIKILCTWYCLKRSKFFPIRIDCFSEMALSAGKYSGSHKSLFSFEKKMAEKSTTMVSGALKLIEELIYCYFRMQAYLQSTSFPYLVKVCGSRIDFLVVQNASITSKVPVLLTYYVRV